MFAATASFTTHPLTELHAALDGCSAETVAELPDAALSEDLVELRRAADRVEAEFARRLAAFDRRKSCRLGDAAADHLRHYLAPERMQRDARDEHDRRALVISPLLDGVFRIDGHLDREGGACLWAALVALLPPRAADATRTPAQRRADALVELARQRMEAAGGRPHVSLIVRAETLAGSQAAPGGELGRAGVVPAETALRIACDASISVVTVDSSDRLLNVDPATRTVPSSLRRALVARDRGCRFPSCDRPPEWTDGHHLKHRAHGGEMKARNLVLLCRRHHRLVHEGGWRLEWAANGELLAILLRCHSQLNPGNVTQRHRSKLQAELR